MKQSTSLLTFAIVLLIFLNFALLYIIRAERKANWNQKLVFQTSNDSLKILKSLHENLMQNISLIFENQYNSIDNDIIFLDENNNKSSIKQVILNSPKLVFNYSKLNCNICVDEQITILKKASKTIGLENILILTDYNSPRDLSRFIRLNQINFKVLNRVC